ncbi:transcriptional regulatory protein [Mycobacteroides abscessus subsp. abscessus]|nr:transcriptional regulatory protein [Mycobacteroides abscessus subsp. abscessus]
MNKTELRHLLFEMSESELKHKQNPELGLTKYKNFKTVSDHAGDPVYVFDFDMNHIWVTKHSRYSVIPMHIHSFVEINYVYAGSCTQIINGKEIQLIEGDVCILDTNVPHTIKDTYEEDIIINFLLPKSFISTSFLSRLAGNGIISSFLVNSISTTQNHNRYIMFHSGQNEHLKDVIENVLLEYFQPQIFSKDIIESYMIIIFGELLRTYQDNKSQEYIGSSKTYLGDILQYLEDNFNSCSLISTAQHFNFHPNYLSTYLKKSTGHSFKDLIQMQRMTRACILLINSNMNIDEIAHEIGYKNLGFFYKKFQELYGLTPHEYRKKSL